MALSILFGAPFVPTSLKEIKRMLEILQLKPGEIFYDLGSGDGRIVIEAAKNYKARAIGIEINPILVFFSRLKIKKLGLDKNVQIHWGNFFRKDISGADAISTYLFQSTNNLLEKKFLLELKPKTRIVSSVFHFKNLPYLKSHPENQKIRLYQIP